MNDLVLKFGAGYYTVRFQDEPFPDNSAWGCVNHERMEIILSNKGVMLEHACHEADHIFGRLAGYDTTGKKGHEECERRANAQAAFVMDNLDLLIDLLTKIRDLRAEISAHAPAPVSVPAYSGA